MIIKANESISKNTYKKRFYQIPHYELFSINSDGIVTVNQTGEIISPFKYNNIKFIRLIDKNGDIKEFELGRLMAEFKYGPIDLPIIYSNGDKTDVSWNNIRYQIKYDNVDIIDNTTIKISNAILKKYLDTSLYISNSGVVYDINNKLRTIGFKDIYGHRGFVYWIGRKSYNMNIHRMLYQVWIGNIPTDLVVNHMDNNPLNNEISNLELVTPHYNVLHGLIKNPKRLHCVINVDEIPDIFNKYNHGVIVDNIAKEYDTSHQAIADLLNKRHWSVFSADLEKREMGYRYTDDATIQKLFRMYNDKASLSKMERETGFCRMRLTHIFHNPEFSNLRKQYKIPDNIDFNNRTLITEKQVCRAFVLFNEGKSLMEISRVLGSRKDKVRELFHSPKYLELRKIYNIPEDVDFNQRRFKLTMIEANEIRSLSKIYPRTEIAKIYNIGYDLVRDIQQNISYIA